MTMRYIAILWVFLFPSFVEAATYWVSPSGGATVCANVSGTEDPGAYMTLAAMDSNNCASAGDTVMFKSGTYTGAQVRMDLLVPSGSSPSNRSKVLCEGDQTCILAFSSIFNPDYGLLEAWNIRNYVIGERGHGFVSDCTNIAFNCRGINIHISSAGIYSFVKIEGNRVQNPKATGLTFYENQPSSYYTDLEIRYNTIVDHDLSTNEGSPHGIYLKGDRMLVEYNHVEAPNRTNSYAMHGWHIAQNATIRYNYFEVAASARGYAVANNETGLPVNNLVHNNVWNCPTNTCGIGLHVHNQADSTTFYNNVVSGFSTFITVSTGNSNTIFTNNLCTNGACGITNSGTNFTCGGTCSTTNPTVTAASHFVNAASGNFSLLSTSSQINAGANVGLPFNGASPDRGAFETVGAPTSTITTNVLSLTYPMNLNTPIDGLSTTGVSVACSPNPTACPGSPTVAAVSRRSGASTIVDVTISGIASNACLTGQDWTVTYNSATGTWRDSINVGGDDTKNQKIFSSTSLAATNLCTGSGPPTAPGGLVLEYLLNEGTGTTADNTGSLGAAADGTLQNGAGWGAGIAGTALAITEGTTEQLAVVYGNGVNVGTQDLTIGVWVFVNTGTTTGTHYVIGPSHGTNQRYYLCAKNGSWKLAIQDQTCTSAADSNLAVTEGWQQLCWTNTASTNTAQLYRNGVAGTGGATRTFTDFSLASNFTLGRVATLNTTGGRYDNLVIYTSLESCNDIFLAAQPPSGGTTGTFGQAAVQAQAVYLTEVGATPTNYGTLNSSKSVVAFGGQAWVFQIHCENVADCEPTAFRLAYRKDGAGAWQQVPDSPTSDGVSMWGSDASPYLNKGSLTSRLTGTCAVTTGSTQLTASQVPNIDLPQDGCVMLRYIVQFWDVAGSYFEFRVERESGETFAGTVVNARTNVINHQMVY